MWMRCAGPFVRPCFVLSCVLPDETLRTPLEGWVRVDVFCPCVLVSWMDVLGVCAGLVCGACVTDLHE